MLNSKTFFTVFLFSFFSTTVFSTEGLVEVKTTYHNITKEGDSLFIKPGDAIKYNGSGFIVEYPIESGAYGHKVSLKVVLTAAHLVLGGVKTKREANLELSLKDGGGELSYIGFIADPLNDLAAIVICTPENQNFIGEILKNEHPDFENFRELFNLGKGCRPTGKISQNPPSYATYYGDSLVLSPLEQDMEWNLNVSDWVMAKGNIFYNKSLARKDVFKKVNNSTVVPSFEKNLSENSKPLDILESNFKSSNKFDSMVFENYFKLPLKKGFSGAPVMQKDSLDQKLKVVGVYKSSTLSGVVSGGGYGWYTLSNLAKGLLQQFLQKYPRNLHSWKVTPQGYIVSLNGKLSRMVDYPTHKLLEVSKDVSDSITFEREDRGDGEWVRADNGDSFKESGYSYKSLSKRSPEHPEGIPMSGVLLTLKEGGVEKSSFYPPTIESLRFLSKYNCPSCPNSNATTSIATDVVYVSGKSDFKKSLIKSLKESSLYKVYGSNKVSAKSVKVSLIDSSEKLTITLDWVTDSLDINVLSNNKISFKHPEKGIQEVDYQPVLKIETKNGKSTFVELAGLLYYNTEIPEGYESKGMAFRMVIDNKFHMFIKEN